MILKNILNFLKKLITAEDPNKKYYNEMAIVLSKLKEKALKLEVQLENEKNERQRENIILMLKVIAKQQRKGEKLMQQKEIDSSSSRRDRFIIKPELSPRISSPIQ